MAVLFSFQIQNISQKDSKAQTERDNDSAVTDVIYFVLNISIHSTAHIQYFFTANTVLHPSTLQIASYYSDRSYFKEKATQSLICITTIYDLKISPVGRTVQTISDKGKRGREMW